jgi:hypothetical protein
MSIRVIKEQRKHTVLRLLSNTVWKDANTRPFYRSCQQIQVDLAVLVRHRKGKPGYNPWRVIVLPQQ